MFTLKNSTARALMNAQRATRLSRGDYPFQNVSSVHRSERISLSSSKSTYDFRHLSHMLLINELFFSVLNLVVSPGRQCLGRNSE